MQMLLWHFGLILRSLFQPKLTEKPVAYSFQNRDCFTEIVPIQLCTHSFGIGVVFCKLAEEAFGLDISLELASISLQAA